MHIFLHSYMVLAAHLGISACRSVCSMIATFPCLSKAFWLRSCVFQGTAQQELHSCLWVWLALQAPTDARLGGGTSKCESQSCVGNFTDLAKRANLWTVSRPHSGLRSGGKARSGGDVSSTLWGFWRVGIPVYSVFLPGRNAKKKNDRKWEQFVKLRVAASVLEGLSFEFLNK